MIDEPAASAEASAHTPQDDVDALVAEYERQTAAPAAASNGYAGAGETVDSDGQSLESIISDIELAERMQASRDYRASLQLDQKLNAIATYQHQTDLRATVANVRGDMDPKLLSDDLVQAWIDTQAREDEGLRQAWLGRAENPQMWKAAERILSKQFRQKFAQMPDPNLTEDVAAVSAAVRGASAPTQAEPPPNYGRLSDKDMRAEMQKLGI